MRIVYLNPVGRLGGAETALRELLAGVRATAPEWDLCLVLGEDGPLAPLAREIGVTVEVLPFPRTLARIGDSGNGMAATLWALSKGMFAIGGYAWRLRRRLQALRPAIIHTNGFKMHVLGAWLRPRGTPLIWHLHDYVSSRRLVSRLLRLFAPRCSMIITNSESVARNVRAVAPANRVVRIYNAINLERFAPEGSIADLDGLAGLPPAPEGTLRVGLVGTFAKWKGHKVFLEALSQLPGPAIRGYIIGGPIYQTDGSQWSVAELEAEAGRLGLAGRVGFTGFIPDPSAAIRCLDVLVHASTEPEPFGMVIAEAMACAKPVIVSRAGGAAELFEDGVDAVGHAPGNAEELADRIRQLSSNGNLRRRLGEAGRRKAMELFSTGRLGREIADLYRQSVTGAALNMSQSSAAASIPAA